MHIISAPFNPSFLVSFELKVFVLGFYETIYLSIFERKFLKCGVSLEGLFKSRVSLEKCKGCLEPKFKRVNWNHNPIVLLEGLVWKS